MDSSTNTPLNTLDTQIETAISYYQKAEAYHNLGDALLKQERWEEATTAYRRAIAINSLHDWSYYNLGEALAQQGYWQEAADAYSKALALNANLPHIHRKLGYAVQQRFKTKQKSLLETYLEGIRQNPDKVENYHKAIEFEPKNAQLYLGLAEAVAKVGHLDEAIVSYQMAIALNPNDALAYKNLAHILARKGQQEAAIECWERSLLLDPDRATAQEHFNIANTFLDQRKTEQAITLYRHAIRLKADFFEAYFNLGKALAVGGNCHEAIAFYQKAIELHPNHPQVHHSLGDALLKLNRPEEAIKSYRRAIALNPNFSWSYHNLGDALLKLNRPEEAAVALEKAIALNPDFVWSHYNLGEALTELQKWNEAIAAYRGAIQLQSDLPYVSQKIAYALHQRAKIDLQEALNFYRAALVQVPTDIELYYEALEITKDDPQLYVGLADALVNYNRVNQAISYYQEALKLKPNDAAIKIGLQKALNQNRELETSANSTTYALWLQENLPKPSDLRRMSENVVKLNYKPLISIIVPVYNTPELYLREMIQSVLEQIYPYWELCIADDASSQPHVRTILEEYAVKSDCIKIIYRQENGHISAASNSAVAIATGEFVTLLDHDDLLTPDALYEVAVLLNKHPEADMIYSDEDKIDEQGRLSDPYFKPDWCPDSFLSRMYTCHLGTYRRSLIEEIGGFRVGYEGSQDYDLVLRLTEKTKHIFHIPKLLYHWRIHSASAASGSQAKPYAYEAGAKALEETLRRRGDKAKVISNPEVPGVYTVRYEITDYKLVSIIIPTRNLGNVLDRCLRSIFHKSTYPNYEVILIDNGSDEPETLEIIASWKQREPNRFKYHVLDIPFNYSRINNYAVTHCQGDYLLFLNNDTEIITPDWIEAMVEQAQRPNIGAIGAKLLYPDNTVQHAGVVLGIGGVAGHAHKYFPANHEGYMRQLISVNNFSAVTAACLMCRREIFERVGGFDEELKVAFNDVDFCLKLIQQGYRNVYLPHAVLYHYESKSRGYEDTPEKQRRFQEEIETIQQRWGEIIALDPCYSPHLTRDREDYSLNVKAQIEITDIFVTQLDAEKLWGFSLDSPQLGQLKDQPLLIAGWVVGCQSEAIAVEIICNGQAIDRIDVNHTRPDVADVFPQVRYANSSGFAAIVDILRLPRQAKLLVQAILKDGNSVLMGAIELCY